MLKYKIIIALVFLIFFLSFLNSLLYAADHINDINFCKETIIENFDCGNVIFDSYPGEDIEPESWQLDSLVTYDNSPYSLKLFGNTWKIESIQPEIVDSGDVWQVSAYIDATAEIQGFGIMDSINVLFYSFAGSEELDIEQWVTVYQGNYPVKQWNNYLLPVADDWLAFFDYIPKITSLVFINDKDDSEYGVVFFDNIVDISEDLPIAPEVSIDYSRGKIYTNSKGNKLVDVQFYSEVTDPDSDEHDFFWNFGDDSTSTLPNPDHTFLVSDDHAYTVLLQVVDSTDKCGEASCSIMVDPGSSTFPITLNFVGDIMLARKYEEPGGIIPTQGVESIFEPTLSCLGEDADITIANLECPLTTHWEHHPTKTIYFKGSPDNVDGLTYAGIDVVTLANNHILDYMLPGMQETQTVLEQNNIIHSGAGADSYTAYQPAFYSKSGVNFAFLASSDRTGQYNNYQPYLNAGFAKPGFAYMTPYYIRKQIKEVENTSDLIVMEWHAGSEYSLGPGSNYDFVPAFVDDCKEEENYSPLIDVPHMWDRKIRHFAIDNGADLVVCHHPHIIQGVELYKGKLIAHSLGNFVFDLSYPETFPSMILKAKVNETGLYEYSLTPVYIDDYIPQRAEGELGLHILDYIAQRSKQLNTYLKVDRENAIASVIMDTLNMNIQEDEYIISLPCDTVDGFWQTLPHSLEKNGSISSLNQIYPTADFQYRLGREKVWFGNMEDEGCTLWNLNSNDESFCDSVAYNGSRSIQHRRNSTAGDNIVTDFEKRIICRSDTSEYCLCGYIKTQNGAKVTIEIRFYEDRYYGPPLGEENIGTQINGNTPWTFYHNSFSVPAATEFFVIRLTSDVPVSGKALSWFDDVSLIHWDEWQDFTTHTDILAPNDYYFLQARTMQNLNEIDLNYSETIFDEPQTDIDDGITHNNKTFSLKQNYPNPFRPRFHDTKISFSLKNPQSLKLSIYNIKGQRIKILLQDKLPSGKHYISWDGTNDNGTSVSSGIYLYKLSVGSDSSVKKLILWK